MSQHNHSLYFHISKKQQITWLDKIAVVVAFAYPLSALPQALEALKGNVEGVSISSWLSFMLFSMFFIVYGTVHKIKPMIIANVLWFIIDALVVVGVLTHTVLGRY